MMESVDDLMRYLEQRFRALQADASNMIWDVMLGFQKDMSKNNARWEKLIYALEEEVRAIKEEKRKRPPPGVGRGRGVSILGRTAPLTLNTAKAA